jgi:hypothetical protein
MMLEDDRKKYNMGEEVESIDLHKDFIASNDAFIKKIKDAKSMTFEGFGRRLKERDRNKYIEDSIREKAKIAKQLGLDTFTEDYYKKETGLIPRDKKAEGGFPDLNKDGEVTYADVLKGREVFQEGGSIDDQMMMVMTPPMKSEIEPEMPMESDGEMEDGYTRFIMEEALSEDEEDMLMSKLEQDEELAMLFDKVIDVAQEFAGSGPVEGPGSGVSDSIPARLSDGEFVFTAKAVEEIGADNLMSMMKDAEAKADERQGMRMGGTMLDEDSQVDQYGRPLDSEIAEEELKKSMLSVNPRFR